MRPADLPRALRLDRSLFRELVGARSGLGLGATAVLAALVAGVPAAELGWGLHRFVTGPAAQALEGFPRIEVRGGVASVAGVSEPWVWSDPESGAPFLVVDTTGAVSSLEGRPEQVLLKRNVFQVRAGALEVRTIAVRFLGERTFDGPIILGWLEGLARWAPVLRWVGGTVVLSVAWGVRNLVLGGLAAWLARLAGAPLPVAAGVRLATATLVPLALLDLVVGGFGAPPSWGLTVSLLGVALLSWSVTTAVLED